MAGLGMKNSSKPRLLRPSPNELQETLRQEREKWRVFRIQQAKQEAQRVREAVRRRERQLLDEVRQDVEASWQVKKEQRVNQLEAEYLECLNNIGKAHRQAQEQPNPEKVLQQRAEHNQRVAAQRGQEAARQQKEEEWQQHHQRDRLLRQRQDVLRLEKLRARHVADLPVPQAFRKKIVQEKKEPAKVAFHEAGTFTTTHYIPQNVRVEKEVLTSKPSAKERAAAEEVERARQYEAQQRQAEEERARVEQRGREALKREHLTRLMEQLMAGLDEAQRHHHLSLFLHGKDGAVWETEETRLKEQMHQQKQMEEAVEELMQEEEHEKQDKDEEDVSSDVIPEPSMQSSDYLEEIESENAILEGTSKTKVRGLRSLLKEVERRRNRILQDLEDSIPVRGPSGDGSDSSPRDQETDIHMADTVPIHLHSGHPSARSPPKGPVTGQPATSQAEGRPTEAQPDTTETQDSSSTVLPLSEESIPVSSGNTLPSTSPSPPQRHSAPQEHQPLPGDTHARQPQPRLAEFHSTTTSTSSLNSDDLKINIDLDVDSSSVVALDNSAEQSQQQQQPESYVSSTEYYSLPSDLPGKESLQEIEDNVKRIQEHRQRNQHLIDSLSRKRGSPDQHMSTTYLEELKEDGSGKRPLTRKEKYELKKKEIIRFYIEKLLQREDQDGELSASTVEGSGLSLSSLGSFLGYLEGEGLEHHPSSSPSVNGGSTTQRSPSSYEDIDEFPVKMKPRDCHHPLHTSLSSSTSSVITTSSSAHSIHTDHHYITTYPSYHITSTTAVSATSPLLTPHQPVWHPDPSSSSTSQPHYYVSKAHPRSHSSTTSTSTSLKPELSGDGSASFTSTGSSIPETPQEISSCEEGHQKYITPLSYLTPPREDESSLEGSEVATELPIASHADPIKRLQWYATQRQRIRDRQQIDTTTTSEDTPRGTTTKLSELYRKHLTDSKFPETITIPSVVTQTSSTSSDGQRLGLGRLSKISWTKMSNVGSTEAEKTSISSVTSTTTTRKTGSHSSEESSVSMPDMEEVLRRFGLGKTSSNSSLATPSNEEDGGKEE
ncbi:mucin-5AC-like isoform X2 [Portunus trituberculatus]|uniref:mucin-5AC-like isoform X2 n=1 Tax=Portunus trituberculatus TaxID=210409 RepID=UPI001E1D09CA|nr:mucin-5AC-like isoform X2 [Portunus trituberculatus]